MCTAAGGSNNSTTTTKDTVTTTIGTNHLNSQNITALDNDEQDGIAIVSLKHIEAMKKVNGTVVCLRIDKIGLKDAETYIDPMLSVVVADWQGVVLDSYDVPISAASRRNDQKQHIFFQGPDAAVYLNVSLEQMV